MPLSYPDATLPHDWHLDPERIPVPAAPRTARAHAEEVRRRRALLTPEQRAEPHYVVDSPNWARWFAFEHEEARRRAVRGIDHSLPPPALVVRDEDREAEAVYQAAIKESEEEERWREADEAAFQAAMAEAMALSTGGDCVVPPVTPPSPPKAETEEPAPLERYSWTGVVREWVSAPSIWLGATEKQEAAYLDHWRRVRLVEKRREGERLQMLEREAEEQAHQPQAAAAQPDIAALWNTTFPWAGPAPTLIDLTGTDADAAADEDA